MTIEIDLSGRVALVTGAGPRNGRAIATALATAGASVAVSDVRPDPAEATADDLRSRGATAIAVPLDITDPEAVRAGIARVDAELGGIDILVNNAGAPPNAGRLGLFKDSDPSRWHEWIDINLYGAMYAIRAVLPAMVERKWGRIVQISSGSSYRPPLDGERKALGVSLYGASKAGIEGLIRYVAVESAKDGVRANALSLGLIGETSDPAGVAQIPLGRPGKPTEVAGAVVWLCSDAADFVTGQVIHVNGGGVLGRSHGRA